MSRLIEVKKIPPVPVNTKVQVTLEFESMDDFSSVVYKIGRTHHIQSTLSDAYVAGHLWDGFYSAMKDAEERLL